MGEILGVRLRLIACAVGRRCLLIADGDFGGGVAWIVDGLVNRKDAKVGSKKDADYLGNVAVRICFRGSSVWAQ
jgi:hypothetical protein